MVWGALPPPAPPSSSFSDTDFTGYLSLFGDIGSELCFSVFPPSLPPTPANVARMCLIGFCGSGGFTALGKCSLLLFCIGVGLCAVDHRCLRTSVVLEVTYLSGYLQLLADRP